MIKKIVLVFIGMSAFYSFSQFGISGGVSMLKAFGTPKPYIGFHLGGELPQDDQNSFYGRISFYAKQLSTIENATYVEAINPMTTFPSTMTVPFKNSMNYTIIEGGRRYYIGDGYDSGFGGYGGAKFMAIFNTVKRIYGDYDQTKYRLTSTEFPKGSIFNLGVGFGGGVKYTLAGIGTVYLDIDAAYIIYPIASNSTASGTDLYSPLLFSFNLGFRKDIY